MFETPQPTKKRRLESQGMTPESQGMTPVLSPREQKPGNCIIDALGRECNSVQLPTETGILTICGLIGKGAFGKVYEGKYGKIEVAIKICKFVRSKSDPCLKIIEEIKFLEKGIVIFPKLYYSYPGNGYITSLPFFVMEKINKTVRNHMNAGNCFDVLVKIIEGVKSIQKHNIIHGDLHIENIMIDSENKIRFIDLGETTEIPNGLQAKHECYDLRYLIANIAYILKYNSKYLKVSEKFGKSVAVLDEYLPPPPPDERNSLGELKFKRKYYYYGRGNKDQLLGVDFHNDEKYNAFKPVNLLNKITLLTTS